MFIASKWTDFEVLDTGRGEKLERWGDYLLARPDPQVIWPRSQDALWPQAHAHYLRSERGGDVSALAELLARQPFRDTVPFERVLNLELRRMRRTGAAVIITSRLTAPIVEAVTRIRRMGPSARLYLCTYTPDRPEDQPLVSRLQHHLVEVCYVTPA